MGLTIAGTDLGFDLPTFTTFSGWGFWITLVVIILTFTLAICGLVYWWWIRKTYNKKIEIYENISGAGWQKTGLDRARILKVGDGGEELMYLKKKKVYRTAYGKKMGFNTYWFAIGQDGYWYNIILGDLDAKMGMLDIEPIDRDMRYMHVAIRKNIQERYRKLGFMEKYGQVLMSGIFLLIMVIAIWLLIAKVGDLIIEAKPVAEQLKLAAAELKSAYIHLDNICSASGISPAG